MSILDRRPIDGLSLFGIVLGALLLITAAPCHAQEKVLKLFTWPSYINPDAVKGFEEKTGATVEVSHFETDIARDQVLVKSNGGGFDLFIVNGTTLEAYDARHWLAPIDARAVPNLRHVDDRFFKAYPHGSGVSVPYLWGLNGIAYRTDLVEGKLDSWKEFLEAGPRFKAPLAMVDNPVEVFDIALRTLNSSLSGADSETIQAAGNILNRQKAQVGSYSYIPLDETSGLVTGKVAAAYVYSGDYLTLSKYTDKLAFVFPKEGGAIWVDFWVMSPKSTNKELAAAFLDYINQPEVAATNAEYVFYSTPNLAARPLTSANYRDNPIIHPPAEVMSRYSYIQRPQARRLRQMNTIMSQLQN